VEEAEVVVAGVAGVAEEAIKEESPKLHWLRVARSTRALLRETHRSHSIPSLQSDLEEARPPSRLPSFHNLPELRPA
jgi:hypothetical protein